ncbi:MAG: type III pantothenate kinase, partial [Bdellovibrionales bacterium]|nr:type III pantothenate kinase [Bdellovibrionales bacterium]
MLLAIDVGNTHVVMGLYRRTDKPLREQPMSSWRLQSDRKRTVDEYAIELLTLLSSEGVAPAEISQIALSCVVPPLQRVFVKLSRKYLKTTPLVVGPGIKTGMQVHYDDPRSVGADRIVNAVAAKALYGTPVIVVDFGTATTFDVIGASGAYEGGAIAPGLLISADALFEKAAKLPNIELKRPGQLIGKSTIESMRSGIIFGYVSLVDGMIERIREEMEGSVRVIATGGLAAMIADESRFIEAVVPDLTLTGLRL